MFDYSEVLLNIQQTHRQCHDALQKRDWKQAAFLAAAMQLQASALEGFCRDKTGDDK
jgi:hypothetical protein